MPSYGAILACVAAYAIADVHAQGIAGQHGQLRGSSGAGSNAITIRVISKAPFPVILANCESNHTLPAFKERTTAMHMTKGFFQWVVPKGATWDCATGCSECFYLAMGLNIGGELVARIGYESHDGEDHGTSDGGHIAGGAHLNVTSGNHSNEPQEPSGAITGLEFAATESVSRTRVVAVCKDDVCRPDWERDHAVAWGTTIDLTIYGSANVGSKPSGMGQLMPLAFIHAGGAAFHGGAVHHGGVVHGGGAFHHVGVVHAGGAVHHGGVYRPPVWRRPVWATPVYPVLQCLVCSGTCPWLCSR